MQDAAELHPPWNPFGLRPVLKRVWLLRAARRLVIEARRWVRRQRQGTQIAAYMRGHEVRCLQIGAGPTMDEGWLCTDLDSVRWDTVYLDATQPFPIPDASFDCVTSEHMIEHIPYQEGMAMLRECHRILKPGGRVRIATPDLARLLHLYGADNSGIARRYLDWIAQEHLRNAALAKPVFIINSAFRSWGHQFLYDEDTLRESLAAAEFVDIERFEPGASGTERLRGLERHGSHLGNEEINRFETMVLEARRP